LRATGFSRHGETQDSRPLAGFFAGAAVRLNPDDAVSFAVFAVLPAGPGWQGRWRSHTLISASNRHHAQAQHAYQAMNSIARKLADHLRCSD